MLPFFVYRFSRLQELADARTNKDSTDNVKLKLANENRIVGVNLMLRNLGDESTSSQDILRIESKDNSEKFITSLLIVPGIEGVAGATWKKLGEHLNLPAFILQLFNTRAEREISQMTSLLVDAVKAQVFHKKEFFYLVGYSFGSYVTLELARLLEASGMKGHVLLIDGAPNFLKQLSYGHIASEVSDESIQLLLTVAIVQQVFPDENPEDLLSALSKCETWEDKVDFLVSYGKKTESEYSETYLRNMMEALYNRLKIVFDFDTENVTKIKSSITLVRPTEVAVVDIDEDYELSKYTEGSINLKFLEGNHMTMLDNPKLPLIINEADPNLVSDRDFCAYVLSGKLAED